MNKLLYNLKTRWVFGDLTDDIKRLKNDFQLRDFKLGWNEVGQTIDFWNMNKDHKWEFVYSYNPQEYSYARLRHDLKQAEARTYEDTMRDWEAVQKQNNSHFKNKAREVAEKSVDYSNITNKIYG